jgi:ZIP family zinc transporter
LRTVEYALIPVCASVLAAAVATFLQPSKRFRSYIQHLAAGVVFAAVVTELFPLLLQAKLLAATAIGFVVGVIALLAMRSLTPRNNDESSISFSYVAAICADLFVDGWVMGLGFKVGENQGKLLAVALTVELVSLGLALGSQQAKSAKSRSSVIAFVASVDGSLIAGAAAGSAILPKLSRFANIAVIAFGSAALLYLVTEELLLDAHDNFESPFAAGTFFAGFLFILILNIAT